MNCLLTRIYADKQSLKTKYMAFQTQTSHNVQVFEHATLNLQNILHNLTNKVAQQTEQTLEFKNLCLALAFLPTLPLTSFTIGGDRDKYCEDINQCKLYFGLYPANIPTDRSKVLCIIMLLTHKAVAWASLPIETNDAQLDGLKALPSI